jgi:hypothetical protein
MAFSSKEADKIVGGGTGISKVILPGNTIARLLDIRLEVPVYDSNAYNLILQLETEAMGEGFEGLPIDKDMPELGNYEGQVARVQSQQYSYIDYTNKDGKTTKKEDMIFRWIWSFAKEIGVAHKMAEADVSGDTIAEYVENAKPYLISKDRWIHFCIGGAEYENKNGYTQYRLFVVRAEKNRLGFELCDPKKEPTKLIAFNEAIHVKKKKPSEPVEGFSGKDAGSDLDLD